VASSFFVVMYVAVSLPVIGEGLLAQATGLRSAGLIFAAGVAVVAIAALVLLGREHAHAAPRLGGPGESAATAGSS
jgi:hypothetical protein